MSHLSFIFSRALKHYPLILLNGLPALFYLQVLKLLFSVLFLQWLCLVFLFCFVVFCCVYDIITKSLLSGLSKNGYICWQKGGAYFRLKWMAQDSFQASTINGKGDVASLLFLHLAIS